MNSFRFSPNPNQAHLISWLPWGPEAFAKAQAETKPVLLSVSAVWCYWCHVMDETTYSDPDVAKVLGDHFVAVRVDSDQRPDINARYNVGGWPTTAFLTGHGGLMGGATYLPPDQFLAMMAEIQSAYADDRSRLYHETRELHQRRRDQARRVAAGPEVEPGLVDSVARVAAGAYDAKNGGFGAEPKFPSPQIAQFIGHLARTTGEEFYLAMLRKTLDGMDAGELHDREEGGFYRHCAGAAWTEPQYEKLLEDNLGLAQLYLDADFLLDNDAYHRTAAKTINYLMEHLFDANVPGFRGSQGSHSDYFTLTLENRLQEPRPPVDPSCFTSANAQAVSLLLDVSWRLGRPGLGQTALSVLAVIDKLAQAGKLSHVYGPGASGEEPAFLIDWVHLLNANLSAHAFTVQESYLERAKALATQMIDEFFDQDKGGFFDIQEDAGAIGHLQIREKPLPDNATAALALIKLYQVTRNDDYLRVAETALSAFVESYREYGEFSAIYGLAVDRLKNSPVEVTIEGTPQDPGTQALLRAAFRLPSPHLEIKPIPSPDPALPAQAHVCLDTVCLPPVSDPAQLAEAVANMAPDSPFNASPFENIFERFPGN
ncbi:MAG: hypothetical protein BZY88_03635 [SAR202 cluster bacterium Io17-Chloro-G9]|nr:MAG: hypothetical protein BZY88_03635 [SAR202 cluster bacterium Io17-Chloro-G9]